MFIIDNAELMKRAENAAAEIMHYASSGKRAYPVKLYPVPRGGVPAAYAILSKLPYGKAVITEHPVEADFFIDDILDSGATLERWSDTFPGKLFITLVDKQNEHGLKNEWVVFPWEGDGGEGGTGIEENIRRVMQFIGEDPEREGLLETPKRVAKALKHWYSGYGKDPKDVIKVFEDGSEGCDEMVVVEDIPFFSNCEHHMAPIIGTATIGYIPNGKIIGLSKMPRLLEIFARRMQVQERLTTQVADAMQNLLDPLGCGVIVKARHLCMESRGVEKIGSYTTTSALRGVFKTQPATRAEFLNLGNGKKPF